MRCSPSILMSVTVKLARELSCTTSVFDSTGVGGGVGPSAGGGATGPGTGPWAAAAGDGVWAEHTAEPAHSARVVTNPNRFMNRLPARVLLEVCVECRFAWRFLDRLRMNRPGGCAAGAAKLQGQVARFGIGL